MHKRTFRQRNGAITLPIVDVDFVLIGLKDPRTKSLINGVRRQAVEKVVQMLETAKRDQIDGCVELDCKDAGLLLQTMALTVEYLTDTIQYWFEDGEQT